MPSRGSGRGSGAGLRREDERDSLRWESSMVAVPPEWRALASPEVDPWWMRRYVLLTVRFLAAFLLLPCVLVVLDLFLHIIETPLWLLCGAGMLRASIQISEHRSCVEENHEL